MSRNILILMAVLGAGIASLIVLPKLRSPDAGTTIQADPGQAAVTTTHPSDIPESAAPLTPPPVAPTVVVSPAVPAPRPPSSSGPGMQQVTRLTPPPGQGAITIPGMEADADAAPKPLPELEKSYLATTNQEERLDILMDIADNPSAESIKALTRLFTAETDPELKIDLLDSLLAIDGFKDEKLELLKLGVRAGLPMEVRQSAIDGLIDLDDPRVVAVFNGLLNDPDEEIRETAKDAIEMLQPETPVKP